MPTSEPTIITETSNVDEFVSFTQTYTSPGAINAISTVAFDPVDTISSSGINVTFSGSSINVTGKFSYCFPRTFRFVNRDNTHQVFYKVEDIPTSFDGLYSYTPPPVSSISKTLVITFTYSSSTTPGLSETGILNVNFVVRNNWQQMNAALREIVKKGSKY